MEIVKYLFIVKSRSLNSSEHNTSFKSNVFSAAFVGAASVDEACAIADAFVRKGVSMIDLCSGFNHEDARRVFDSIDGKVKVSYAGVSFL
ncbi:hypothetical protein MASR2M70_03640 [Bacillota bacterium]